MKRLLAMLLALSMVISLLPATVLAEEVPEEETFLEEQLEEPQEEPQEEPEEETDPTEEETTAPTEEETTAPTEEETVPPAEEEATEPSEEEPISEEAALEAGETSGTCGEKLTWAYDEDTKTLTISGVGGMADYENNYDAKKTTAPWGDLDVKTLVIEKDVTSVGDWAFYGMSSLTGALELPSSLENIGWGAFSNTGLTSVTLNEGLIKIDGGGLFGEQ